MGLEQLPTWMYVQLSSHMDEHAWLHVKRLVNPSQLCLDRKRDV